MNDLKITLTIHLSDGAELTVPVPPDAVYLELLRNRVREIDQAIGAAEGALSTMSRIADRADLTTNMPNRCPICKGLGKVSGGAGGAGYYSYCSCEIGHDIQRIDRWIRAHKAPADLITDMPNRCPVCKGVGKLSGGYCSCPMGRDLAAVESRTLNPPRDEFSKEAPEAPE